MFTNRDFALQAPQVAGRGLVEQRVGELHEGHRAVAVLVVPLEHGAQIRLGGDEVHGAQAVAQGIQGDAVSGRAKQPVR